MTQEEKQLLVELGVTNYGKILQKYFNERLAELNNVTTITSYDDALGRKEAVKIIKQLLSIMDKPQVEGGRSSYE